MGEVSIGFIIQILMLRPQETITSDINLFFKCRCRSLVVVTANMTNIGSKISQLRKQKSWSQENLLNK